MAKENKAADTAEPKYSVTKAQLIADRKAGLSWAKIAQKHSLGSPGAARTAWKVVVGSPHTEAPQLERGGRPAGTGNADNGWQIVQVTDATTIAKLRKALEGNAVQVQPIKAGAQVRKLGAVKVANYRKTEGTVDLVGADDKAHTVALDRITAVRPLA
jgi:hypothetical protein